MRAQEITNTCQEVSLERTRLTRRDVGALEAQAAERPQRGQVDELACGHPPYRPETSAWTDRAAVRGKPWVVFRKLAS